MTSNRGLERLTIAHLRGSTEPFTLEFDRGKRLTIVYGANASGKSTICDAFEFLGSGRVGSIDGRGLGTTDPYWHSVGKRASDISVELAADGNVWRATKGSNGVLVVPADQRPRTEVLRRARVLALIEATAGKRYEQIERFIDVRGIEASEKNLRDLIRDLKQGRGEAVAAVAENEKALEDLWVAAGRPAPGWLAWAQAEAGAEIESVAGEVSAIERLESTMVSLREADDRRSRAAGAAEEARNAVSDAEDLARDAAAAATADAAELTRLLGAARTYLEEHREPDACPVCESRENVHDLRQRVDQRLASLGQVERAQQDVIAAQQGVERRTGEVESAHDAVTTAVADFALATGANGIPEGVPRPGVPPPSEPGALAAWLEEHAQLTATWRAAREEREERERRHDLVASALTRWQENTDSQHDLDALIPKLETALTIVEEERKAFTDDALSAIAAEVGRLYEEIHPGEGLSKISLQLDPKKRASLALGSEFEGREAPPQAYFSDSHLDTLSLCIFVALAKLDDPGATILVLDDVLTSSDEPHVDRAIEMICRESANFRHCIVTTHYKPWKHKLKWGWIEAGDFQFVELGGWTPTNGLALIATLSDVERLRTLLAESHPDPQLVCAKAGYILEAALNFLTIQYECPVPRKPDDRYTLGDLLPGIGKKLRATLRVEHLSGTDGNGEAVYATKEVGPLLDELTRIAQARNVFGCHFNEVSLDLLDSDAIAFGGAVLNLIDALTDPATGWPKNKRSGQYWATSGNTRRMHPLVRPS